MMMIMAMGSRFLLFVDLIVIMFSCIGTTGHSLNGAISKVQCIESEREALLRFKRSGGFTNPSSSSSGLFSSWVVEEDCCRWIGVECNNSTGHVIALDLSSSSSSRGDQTEISQLGELSDSLLGLPYLSYLDLSQIDFRQIQIPQFIGSLINLEHINLSNANFKGTIPDHLGNLSRLQSLDLSGKSFYLKANNLHWLRGLSSMEVLDLGKVDLSSAVDWLDSINMLPSLVKLRLSACQLRKPPLSLQPHVINFTSLEILDLSSNSFYTETPHWLFNYVRHMSSLVYLSISRSHLQGFIPNAFENMTSLAVLDLSENSLEGEIPTNLGLIRHEAENQVKRRPSALRELYLHHNRLNGSLEQSLSGLSQLVVLDVASNSLEGGISDAQLMNFSSLRVLDLSSNSLNFNISPGWIPPFQLQTIRLRSCQLGPQFPEWLRTQKDFLSLDISNANISGVVPHWFWNLSNNVQLMNLSHNQLRGKVPDLSLKVDLLTLDLSCNYFDGPLPHFSPSMVSVALAKNSFSGPISSICELLVLNNSLSHLDLSENNLSGEIPDCWAPSGQKMVSLNLVDNNLSGKIPNSIGHLVRLESLRLGINNLSGDLPSTMKNCTGLFILGLSYNRLSGNLPAWIGEQMQNLLILSLSTNAFEGNIPLQLCQLKSLRILDLSGNRLSGTIPRCINNFLGMSKMESDQTYIYDPYNPFRVGASLEFVKRPYNNLLKFLKLIYLSSNNLSGSIPREITSLNELGFLDLSGNSLAGAIPDDIGDMEFLQFLDLSRNELSCTIPASLSNLTHLYSLNLSHNRLSGKIPASLSNLTDLYFLNLSYNRLSGKIPSGGQLKALDASAYMENQNLCGPPLANHCLINGSYEDPHCGKKE